MDSVGRVGCCLHSKVVVILSLSGETAEDIEMVVAESLLPVQGDFAEAVGIGIEVAVSVVIGCLKLFVVISRDICCNTKGGGTIEGVAAHRPLTANLGL